MQTAANDVTTTVTKAAVEAFFQQWEEAFRKGETLTPEQARELSVSEVAKANTEHFWKVLALPESSPP
jgi:hypothetical protein